MEHIAIGLGVSTRKRDTGMRQNAQVYTMTPSLWLAPPGRYFIIPGDFEWPMGTLALSDVLGESRRVDAGAAGPYEVDAETARAFAERRTAEIDRALGERRAADDRPLVERITDDLRRLERALDAEGIDDLLARLGLSLDMLSTDPGRAAAVWAALVEDTVAVGQSGDLTTLAGRWSATLRRHGYAAAADRVIDAPAQIEAWLKKAGEKMPDAGSPAAPRDVTAAEVIAMIEHHLTPSQQAEVRAFSSEGQPRLAVEFALQFVSDNDAWLTAEAGAAANAYLQRVGSDWHPVDALVRAPD